MCNKSGIIFVAKSFSKEDVKGKKVIEVGSYDVNGSVRSLIEFYKPAKYIGVDIENGPGVDIVCNAEDLLEKFGKESFDIVISTELLEHVRDWRKVISNFKNICSPGGIILITTRSHGFGYHAYPHDFWRFEVEDMDEIFSDYKMLSLEKDCSDPGVFVKLKKPNEFKEKELANHKLYSIVSDKRVIEIDPKDFRTFYFMKVIFNEKLKDIARALDKMVFKAGSCRVKD